MKFKSIIQKVSIVTKAVRVQETDIYYSRQYEN